MNPRRLIIHAAVAIVALASAYTLAKRSASHQAEVNRPVVFDLRKDELRELHFASVGGAVTIEPRFDDQKERYAWVTVAPVGKRPVSFRGGRFALHVLEGYTPLRAIRTLGKLTQTHLQEGGLADPKDTVLIKASSGEQKLALGTGTVGGEGRRALAVSTGQVYLLPNDLLPAPERAAVEMFEPTLHAFPADEVTRIVVESRGRSREAIIQGKQDPPPFWSWKEDPEHPNQELTSWAEHVSRLAARSPLVVDNSGDPSLTVTYFHGENPRGFLKLWPCQHEERRIHCAAVTEYTVGFVEVSPGAEQIENDAERMLGSAAQGERAARTMQ